MDKGIKKLQDLDEEINRYNAQIIDTAVKRALKFKGQSLSSLKDTDPYVKELLINKNTMSSDTRKNFLLSHCSQIQQQYPFLTVQIDPHKLNDGKRKLKSVNDNRLLIIVDIKKYKRQAGLKLVTGGDREIPTLGLDERFREMMRHNEKVLHFKITECLSKANDYLREDGTDFPVNLAQGTMTNEVTRNHFNAFSKEIVKPYGNTVQIFAMVHSDIVVLRINWNIHRAELAEMMEVAPLIIPSNHKFIRVKKRRCKDTSEEVEFPYPPLDEPSSDDFSKKSEIIAI